jgi:hypothetical protein
VDCRHDTDPMNDRVRKLVSRMAIGLVVLLVAYVVWDYMVVDSCLDQGGRWNYSAFKCETQ